jgi:hypothetical protein
VDVPLPDVSELEVELVPSAVTVLVEAVAACVTDHVSAPVPTAAAAASDVATRSRPRLARPGWGVLVIVPPRVVRTTIGGLARRALFRVWGLAVR